jgi:peptide chain release factor
MADPVVNRDKERRLAETLAALGVRPEDLVEKFVLGSGPGGQKVNKTSSCVYLRHVPTGIEVKCGRARSRALNRFLARRELCERIEAEIEGRRTKRQAEIERIRRQKRRRTRRQKQKMLEEKKQRGALKKQRARIDPDAAR